jgi:hypothetical protein
MTNRERIWRRACNWVKGWQGGKSTPTPEMAYLAGWQAAMREVRKQQRPPRGSFLTDCDMH